MKLKVRVVGLFLSLGIIANAVVPINAKQLDTALPANALQLNSFEPEIHYIDNVDNPSYILGKLTEESNMSPQNIVRKYYNNMLETKTDEKLPNKNKVTYSKKQSNKDFKIVKDFGNSRSKNVVKTIQMYNGTPVYGTEKNFHINQKGVIECIVGSTVEDIEQRVKPLNPTTKVNPATVKRAIEKDLGFEPKYETPPKQEMILFPVGEYYVYAYKVRVVVGGEHRIDANYIVDANNLSIIEIQSNIASYEQPILGSGIGQSGTVINNLEITADYANNTFYLKSMPENIETCLRYLSNGSILCPIITENDSFFNSGNSSNYQTHGVDAHNNLTKVSRFFRSAPFYRNGNDDMGSTLVARILKHDPYRLNAYSTVNEISFCTGLGPAGKSTAVALDIAGHEYTHGILFSEGLAYTSGTSSEYGAIHEGVADVFGTLCEYFIPHEGVFDWTAGEDTGTVMRDCANPEIDDYVDYIQNQPLPHLGGGVITKAAYLIANGGTHNNQSVTGIGYGKLAKIFYDAINDGYIVENMTFMQFSAAVIQAATLLYGADSQEVKTVRDAFIAVKVMNDSPTNLRVTGRSGLNLTLAWNGIPGAKYGIYRRSHGLTGPIGLPGKIAETTATSLPVETLYGICDFYVAVVDSNGNRISAYSNPKTIESYPYDPPTNFKLNNKNGSSVKFTWNSNSAGRYAIYRKVAETSGEPVKLAETTGTSLTVNALQGSWDYYVATVNSSGIRTSAFSAPITVGEFISAPTSFWYSGGNGLNANLGWWHEKTGVRFAVYRKLNGSIGDPEKVLEFTNTDNMTNVVVKTLPGSCNFYLAIVDPSGNRISEYSYPVTVYAN